MYNQQSKEMDTLMSEYQKMKMRVENYEQVQENFEASARQVAFTLFVHSSAYGVHL